MSIFFYIVGYVFISIAIAIFLKKIKIKKQVIKNQKLFDRDSENDYLNDPKFSYMSCNKHNKKSPFYKEFKKPVVANTRKPEQIDYVWEDVSFAYMTGNIGGSKYIF